MLSEGRVSPCNRSALDFAAPNRATIAQIGGMELRTMPEHPEAIIAGKQRPFTGAEFLDALRDGREVYICGERVKDVTTHPAFRNSAASVALLYDALHDKAHKDVLTWSTDTGSGGYTHKFFRAAHSPEEVVAKRDAIAAWARSTYGW